MFSFYIHFLFIFEFYSISIRSEDNFARHYDALHRPSIPVNISSLTRQSLPNQVTNITTGLINQLGPIFGSDDKEKMGNVVFNVHHFTQFVYDGNQVYIYSPKKNDENIHQPQKWTFFYIPILQPVQSSLLTPWVSVNLLEVRVRLALGTTQVEEAARQAVANQFSKEIVDRYSKLWVIAPLMLDSLSAYVVTVGSTPVPGVAPFHIDNPNSNTITLRFVCLTRESAFVIAAGLLTGNLDIEVSLYFSGMHRVKTNLITLTATHLQSIVSKTVADGGGTNATYIHRDQASNFIGKYLTNVKKLIYIEEPDANLSILTNGLQEQFAALFHHAIANAREIRILANAIGQVWQSTDLSPDRLTSEMERLFIYNHTETMKHNDSLNYYSVNQRNDSYLPAHTPLDMRIRPLISTMTFHPHFDHQQKTAEQYEQSDHNAVSEADIQKAANQVSIEGVWVGHRFIPKAFRVFKLNEIVEQLQVAVIGKQLLAEKADGAVIRRVGALNSLSNVASLFASLDNSSLFGSLENASLLASLVNSDLLPSFNLTDALSPLQFDNRVIGEIKLFAGSSPPDSSWLLCDGSIVSRLAYPRLFAVIGTKYGQGNNSTTFRLPDLRGRVPMGLDPDGIRVTDAADLGLVGGEARHQLMIDELPSHSHDRGTLRNSYDGLHSHALNEQNPNQNGRTNYYAMTLSLPNDQSGYNQQSHGYRRWQVMTMGTTINQMTIQFNGNHTHQIIGQTGSTGRNKDFSILPPFQTFHYLIYAG